VPVKDDKKTGRIFSVGGGKGGVGKSIFSISLGMSLVEKGFKVVIADLDLGTANLHTYIGITKKTPTLADFILKKLSSLDDIIVETSEKNLGLISGAEFVPGMANPAHWMKLKMMRHLKSLTADFVIIDLGAGVHFNTLDFFGISDRGFVVTAPEPGAVMNAYVFIKGAFFRKLQNVFSKHPEIGPLIESEIKKTETEKSFTLEWFSARVREIDPEMLPLIDEIENSFRPALVVNRTTECGTPILVKNLITLCTQKFGITLEYVGNLPDVRTITHYLLNLPKFYDTPHGRPFFDSVRHIVDRLDIPGDELKDIEDLRDDFSDEEIEELIGFIETLDDSVFEGTSKKLLQLRMYFKPSDVLNFLIGRGITHDLFYI